MHGHVPYDVFLKQIAGFLGSYYLFLSLMNGVAAFILWQRREQRPLFRVPGGGCSRNRGVRLAARFALFPAARAAGVQR